MRVIGTRHTQLLLSFCGVLVHGLQGLALSVGILAMTNTKDNSSYPAFDYTISQKGVLLGAFGYGLAAGNILFGYLADQLGPMRVAPISAGICGGIISFSFPSSAIYGGFRIACVAQGLQGFLLSGIYPCAYAHMSKWVVPQEQSSFSWIWAGSKLGNLIITVLAGPLDSWLGWPGIFYFSGGVSVLWGLLALKWGANSPVDHQTISLSEKNYIESRIPEAAERGSKVKTPWLEMVKSLPLWACFIVQTSDRYGADSVLAFEPTYLNGVFNLDVNETGLATACNYLANIPSSFLITYLAVKLEKIVAVKFARKMWTTVGMFGSALASLLLAAIPQEPVSSIVLFVMISMLRTATHPGFMTNVLDIAPNYAGTIAGLMTTSSNFVANAGPVITGLLLTDEADGKSWRHVFILCAILYALGNAVFLAFGSTDVQPWNNLDSLDSGLSNTDATSTIPGITSQSAPPNKPDTAGNTEIKYQKSITGTEKYEEMHL